MSDDHDDRQQTDSADDPLESSYTIPRPGIGHLMLWTAFSAVEFAFNRLFNSGESAADLTERMEGYSIFHAIVSGAVLTGAVVVLLDRKRQGYFAIRQPGHWLLLIQAVMLCLCLAVFTVIVLFIPSVNSDRLSGVGTSFLYVVVAVFGVGAILQVFAALKCDGRWWRILFSGLAFASFLQCLTYASYGLLEQLFRFQNWLNILWRFSSWGIPAVALLILLTSVFEQLQGVRRDWLHWAGVVLFALIYSLDLLSRFLA